MINTITIRLQFFIDSIYYLWVKNGIFYNFFSQISETAVKINV